MIDLHSHLLPGIDDGASDLAMSLAMARALVEDGVSVAACTPHILPGLYHNTGPQIRAATLALQKLLNEQGIPLKLTTGADNHMVPDFLPQLRSGHLLSLADSRYVLVEPPHHVAPPRLEEFFFSLLLGDYIPILTHPERLTWISSHYGVLKKLVRAGVWVQVTAGSLSGIFGKNARYWCERMLDEGCVHLVATDAHDVSRRPPNLNEGRELAAKRVGPLEAQHLVDTRPRGILLNDAPLQLPQPTAASAAPDSVSREARNEDPSHDRGARDDRFLGSLRRLFEQQH